MSHMDNNVHALFSGSLVVQWFAMTMNNATIIAMTITLTNAIALAICQNESLVILVNQYASPVQVRFTTKNRSRDLS